MIQVLYIDGLVPAESISYFKNIIHSGSRGDEHDSGLSDANVPVLYRDESFEIKPPQVAPSTLLPPLECVKLCQFYGFDRAYDAAICNVCTKRISEDLKTCDNLKVTQNHPIKTLES